MLNVNNLNAAAKLLNQTNLLNGTKVSSNDVQQAVSIFSALNTNSTTSINTTDAKQLLSNSIFAAKQDGKDDGKLTFGETVKSLFKGVVKSFTNMFSSPKNIAKTVIGGVACAALIAVTGGAATPFIIAGGAVLGGVQVGKGLYNASQATTDDAKRAALENIGNGAATIAMSVAAGKAYTKSTGSSLTSVSTYETAANKSIANIQGFMKLNPTAAKAQIASVTTLDSSVNWFNNENALNDMYAANSTETMKQFGFQLTQGYTKNAKNEQANSEDFARTAMNLAKKTNIFQA